MGLDEGAERRLHEKQLYIAEAVNELCLADGLCCFLTGDSFLGTVKGQTIVSGDEDIDLGMLREEYEMFLSFADELPDDLQVLEAGKDDTYNCLFAKICLKNTRLSYKEGKDTGTGVYIDICPYDSNIFFREFLINKYCRHITSKMVVQNISGGKKTDWCDLEEVQDQAIRHLDGHTFSVPYSARYLQQNCPRTRKS